MVFHDVETALRHTRERLQARAQLGGPGEAEAAWELASSTLRGHSAADAPTNTTNAPLTGLSPLPALSPPKTAPARRHSTALSVTDQAREVLAAAHADEHNAFTSLHDDEMLRDAACLDSGGDQAGALWGMALAVKDNIDVRNWHTTAGSSALGSRPAYLDAPLIAQLRKAGALLVGQTNMDELAWGGTTDNARYGPTRNPIAPNRSVGGSSGGSAAAVCAGIVPAALGTDTGGSLRLPAAATGTIGFRPSTGRIDSAGVIPLADSFDTPGVIGRSLDDVVRVSEVLCAGSLQAPGSDLRLATWPGATPLGTDQTVSAAWSRLTNLVGEAVIGDVDFGPTEAMFHTWFLIHLIEPALTHGDLLEHCADQLGPGARVPLLAGAALPPELLDGAQAVRAEFNRRVESALADVDAVITPTIAVAPPPIGADTVVLPVGRHPVFTVMPAATWLASMAGLPAISIPIPGTELPVGCQVIGRRGDDAGVLRAARAIQELLKEEGQ